MAPKRGRGASRAAQPTAASQRSRRGDPNTNLEARTDNPEAFVTGRRGRGATRASGRARGDNAGQTRGSTGGTTRQEPQDQTPPVEEPQQQTQSAGDNTTQTGTQQQQLAGGTDPGAIGSNAQDQDQTTPGEQSVPLTTTAGQTADANEAQQSSSVPTQVKEPAKGDSSGGESKRRRSSEGSHSESPKKQKTNESSKDSEQSPESPRQQKVNEGAKTDKAGSQSEAPGTGEKESCVQLRETLATLKAEEIPHRSPVTLGVRLWIEDVYRAVASVTEAISEQEVHQYSLIDWHNLNEAADMSRNPVAQTIARPGHEMFIPWTPPGEGGHYSLFFLQDDAGAAEFRTLHLDSGHGVNHTGDPWHYRNIRLRLRRAEWTGRGAGSDATIPPTSEELPVLGQDGGWMCGLHVILYAWAKALGLRISQTALPRYNDFIEDAVRFIQQAVQGNVSSEDIFALFDRHGFITPGQHVGEGRGFPSTFAFPTNGDLAQRAARVRIQAHLPAGVNWDEARIVVTELTGLNDWENMGTQDFIARFDEAQRRMLEAFPPSQAGFGDGPTAGGVPAGPALGPQQDDDSNPALQQGIAQSLEGSGAGSQPGATSGQSGQATGSGGVTTGGQTSEDINRDHAAAEALQNRLDVNLDPDESDHTSEMQNGPGSGANLTGAPPQGTNSNQGNPPAPNAGSEDPTSSSTTAQQSILPRTIARLNSIPASMIPGTLEHEAQQRRRQADREEALRRTQAARDAAREAGFGRPPSTPTPNTGPSGHEGAEQGTPTTTLADSASNAEDSQTETGDTDDDTVRADNTNAENGQAEQFRASEQNAVGSNDDHDDEIERLFDENEEFPMPEGDDDLDDFDNEVYES